MTPRFPLDLRVAGAQFTLLPAMVKTRLKRMQYLPALKASVPRPASTSSYVSPSTGDLQ